jgi:hypothetical protein
MPQDSEGVIWCDYGCIDQNGDPAGELKQLDKIVTVCDCLFTPTYDANHASWKRQTVVDSIFDVDLSPGWKGNDFSYLNRGWCRVEMFYGANIPLKEDSEQRRGKMMVGLKEHRSGGRRPHFLYGSKHKADLIMPSLLPPLQHSYFEEYHPVKGKFSVASDQEKIDQLVKEIEPYMRHVVVGLVFDDDSDSRAATRKGKETYADGDVYVGEFVDCKRHGYGKCEFADGRKYEGQFFAGKLSGYGKFTYPDGNIYEGEWEDDSMHGQGKLTYVHGFVYEGKWNDGCKHGPGRLISYVEGKVYEGEWKDDKLNGQGKVIVYTESKVFEGEWKNGGMHGQGKCTSYADGTVYEGEWKDGSRHGQGRYTYTYAPCSNLEAATPAPAPAPVPAPVLASAPAAVPVSGTFSLDDLRAGVAGIDVTRKEEYLAPEVFAQVFGMGIAAFKAMRRWKRDIKKREVGLF